LAAAQPQPTPPIDHSKMDHGKMDHGKMVPAAGPVSAKAAMMDCCKEGCTCCAKDKAKPGT
jgi:uncharacterized protein involved in copper resistance